MTKQEQVAILSSLGITIKDYRKKNHHVYTCLYKESTFTLVGSSTSNNNQISKRFRAIAQRKVREIDGVVAQRLEH